MFTAGKDIPHEPRYTRERESSEGSTAGKTSNVAGKQLEKGGKFLKICFISDTVVNQGMKRKSDVQHETDANNSTSAPVKRAKTNASEKTTKSTSVSRRKPAAQRQQPATAATSSEKYTSKSSKKRPNSTEDDTAPDDPKTPGPPTKKLRGKNDITGKPQPVRRTGISL